MKDSKLGPIVWSHEMAKSCTEGTATNQRRSGWEGHGFETQRQQRLFTVESLLKSTFTLMICIHNIISCVKWIVECTFALETSTMSSVNKKRSTSVVASTLRDLEMGTKPLTIQTWVLNASFHYLLLLQVDPALIKFRSSVCCIGSS